MLPLAAFAKSAKMKDGLKSWCKDCSNYWTALKGRDERIRLKVAIFAKHNNKCAHCGFLDQRALQIDHIFGDGQTDNADHRGLGFLRKVLADVAGRYQLLCANCNWIKRHEKGELPRRKYDDRT
jgi:RNase P subunit RPR2